MIKKIQVLLSVLLICIFSHNQIFSNDLDAIFNRNPWDWFPNFSYSNLDFSFIRCCSLEDANLSHSSCDLSTIWWCFLTRANLSYSSIRSSTISDCDLSHANLSNCNLSRSIIKKSQLNNTNFTESNLTKVDLRNLDLSKANFTNANFTNAKLHESKLEGAGVAGANFRCAYGLTNEQKQYLREHGAINVPIDIEYDIDNSEVGHEREKLTLKKVCLGPFIKRYKRYFRSREVGIQTNFEE